VPARSSHDRGDVQAAAAPGRAIAVDGKALAGSAHLVQRHRHLLSTVNHASATITLAQREVGARTNETAAFRPLLESLDLAGAVITFDAMHSAKDQVRWLVQDKDAHYLAAMWGQSRGGKFTGRVASYGVAGSADRSVNLHRRGQTRPRCSLSGVMNGSFRSSVR